VTDNPRILELRRRVQADPASIAFAQLAEECRRSGANDDAVGICRAGLAHHPDYLSARVTLGRALVELGRLDEAHAELTIVLNTAPDNLPAIRSLAEIYQRRGQMPEALEHYRRALQLARHDPDLEHEVERIQKEVATPAPATPSASPVAIEDLFDFDTLLQQLGPDLPPEPPPNPVLGAAAPVDSPLDTVVLPQDDDDPFVALERQLRETEERVREEQQARAAEQELREAERQAREEAERCAREEADRQAQAAEAQAREAERQRLLAVQELEEWLSAIAVDRQQQRSA